MLQGAPVLVIECEDNVEVYDANNLVARIDNILVTINEKNLSDWYGTMSLGRRLDDLEKLSRLQGHILTVAFKSKNKSYTGLITITSEPVDTGSLCRIKFRGVDLFSVERWY